MAAAAPTIHGGAVLIGANAVLIRGPAGVGKSRLALALLQAAAAGVLPFVRLVADDRCHLEACGGQLLVRPAAELAGLIEIRGLGIRRMAYEPAAVVGLVADLGVIDTERLPGATRHNTLISGIRLPHLEVPAGVEALAFVLAAVQTRS